MIIFNKLRLYLFSKDLIVVTTFLEAYKYKVLFFSITNSPALY